MPVDVSKIRCGKCGGSVTTQEYASYGERCENCYCGGRPNSTMGIPAAIRNGSMQGLLKRGQSMKTSRNSPKTG